MPTGRVSSSDPNLQNIPTRSVEGRRIRRAFVPKPGCIFVSADYSQIDLRVMAHLSGDKTLVDAFTTGEDIHIRTATEVLGVTPDKVNAEARRLAKVINFGIIYGMGPQRLAGELGIALAEASDYIKRYFERLPGRARMARRYGSYRAHDRLRNDDVRTPSLPARAERAAGWRAGASGANRNQYSHPGHGGRPDKTRYDTAG